MKICIDCSLARRTNLFGISTRIFIGRAACSALSALRGVGKTTLLLQHILNSDQTNESLFVFADSMYFSEHTLFDTAEAFSKNGGTFLYIDEVHKYEGWSRELKAIYDSFPHLHVRFTGSSVLDIEKGEADLSRRAPKYHLPGPLLPRVSRHAPQHQLRALHARGDTRPQGRNPRSRAPPSPFQRIPRKRLLPVWKRSRIRDRTRPGDQCAPWKWTYRNSPT